MKARESDLADWPARVMTRREATPVQRAAPPPPSALGEHKLAISPYVDCQYEVGRASVHLQRLHVWPQEKRRLGLGGRAVEAIKQIARQLGRPATLTFSPDKGWEAELRRFYERHGFRFMRDGEQMIWRP